MSTWHMSCQLLLECHGHLLLMLRVFGCACPTSFATAIISNASLCHVLDSDTAAFHQVMQEA